MLAGINKIETGFGTNLNVSTAGAVGWMQFLPSTWKAYGVDANGDGQADPYNPVDAICAAARYLKAAGGDNDIRKAVFAYNHASWYVDEVMLYARQYGSVPQGLLGSLTGLTQGDRFPVAANARYADDIVDRQAAQRAKPRQGVTGNVADVVASSPTRRGIDIYSHAGAPVVAVNDGTIKQMGHSKRLGNYIVLEDSYGNRFIYAELGSLAKAYPVPKQQKLTAADFRLVRPGHDSVPQEPASAGTPGPTATSAKGTAAKKDVAKAVKGGEAKKAAKQVKRPAPAHPAPNPAAQVERAAAKPGPTNTEDLRPRLYALPKRTHGTGGGGVTGQLDNLLKHRMLGYHSVKAYLGNVLHFDSKTMRLRPLRVGSRVPGGTVLGRIGQTPGSAPHVNFAIRPTGAGAPKIDPKPILDGWKLLEDTAIYRAAGKDPFNPHASITQALLASKQQLERQVLSDPRLEIYQCGRNDISTGQVDQRVLSGMEYLADNGYRLTITSLKCGSSKKSLAKVGRPEGRQDRQLDGDLRNRRRSGGGPQRAGLAYGIGRQDRPAAPGRHGAGGGHLAGEPARPG